MKTRAFLILWLSVIALVVGACQDGAGVGAEGAGIGGAELDPTLWLPDAPPPSTFAYADVVDAEPPPHVPRAANVPFPACTTANTVLTCNGPGALATWQTPAAAVPIIVPNSTNILENSSFANQVQIAIDPSGNLDLSAPTGQAVKFSSNFSTITGSLGLASSDFIAFGPGTIPAQGAIRINNGVSQPYNVIQALVGSTQIPLMYFDGSGQLLFGLSAAVSNPGNNVLVGAQNAASGNGGGGNAFLLAGNALGSGTGGSVQFNAGSSGTGATGNLIFNFNGGGGDQAQFIGATTSAGRGNLQWSSGVTPSLSQASISSTTQGTDFTITPQNSTQATNHGGGNLVGAFATPAGTGTESGLKLTRGGNLFFQSRIESVSGNGAIWLGNTGGITPNSSNYTLRSDGSTAQFNAATSIGFVINNAANYLFLTSSLFNAGLPIAGGSNGGGTGNPFALNSAQSAIALTSGGNVTLSPAQYQNPVIPLSGTIVAGTTLTVPNVQGTYFFDISAVVNQTNLTFNNAGGASSAVNRTASRIAICVTNAQGSNTIVCGAF